MKTHTKGSSKYAGIFPPKSHFFMAPRSRSELRAVVCVLPEPQLEAGVGGVGLLGVELEVVGEEADEEGLAGG